MFSNGMDSHEQCTAVLTRFLSGMHDITNEMAGESVSFSAAFVLYRLKVNPDLDAQSLDYIVEKSVAAFNESSKKATAKFYPDGPDFKVLITKTISD